MSQTSSPDIQFVRKLLLELFEQIHADHFGGGRPWEDRQIQSILHILRPIHDSRQLEKALPSEEKLRGRLFDNGGVLFLKFVQAERAWPVVDMRWDLTTTGPHRWKLIRFRFFLVRPREEDSKHSAIGFRLEPPESYWYASGEPGIHDYWHSQMILEFEEGDDLFLKITRAPRDWIPISQPAFPLAAESAADLLIILLISIYGAGQLAGLVREPRLLGDLKKRLTRMRISTQQ